MKRPLSPCLWLVLSLGLLGSAPAAAAQGGPAPGAREAMWPAPTAEDWARPCLIVWERSWEDALAVARETKKPILVCVNMDGEIASEHYAGVRYRQPEIASLYEPYICVIASVYRHTPRDFDEEGRRIECPRFGTVTCGEHIAIEPGLFDGFFEGQRVAPRHIGVELDGAEMYDVFYAFDTDTIFTTLRRGIAEREIEPTPIARTDRPLEERVASRHVEDRRAVERAYLEGDREQRRVLLKAAAASGASAPVGVLRLAVFGLDLELARLARQALAESSSPAAVDLIAEALRVPMEASEREALIAALERLGATSARARSLAAVHRGGSSAAGTLDVAGWVAALERGAEEARARYRPALELRLASVDAAGAERDPDSALEFAEASLTLAADPGTDARYAELMREDARRAVTDAIELGASGWRADAARAVEARDRGDIEEAFARAASAVAAMPAGEEGWFSMEALVLFARSRQRALGQAVREKRDWPAEWVTDVDAAYSVLATHPLGTDAQVAMHHDFLRWFGAGGQAARALEAGLERFPRSWVLHDRLRVRTLREKGIDGLEEVYAAMLSEAESPADLEWFAGYASLVAAEFHRRSGNPERALGAYERAIGHYERGIAGNPLAQASSDHYVALAYAGRARLALEAGDLGRALSEVLSSFERRPSAAASLDGLGISPVATAQMLRARLEEAELHEAVLQLDAALARLDPELLRLPAFERMGPGGRRRDGGAPGRGRPGR